MTTLVLKPKTLADVIAENVRRCREPKPVVFQPGMMGRPKESQQQAPADRKAA